MITKQTIIGTSYTFIYIYIYENATMYNKVKKIYSWNISLG